MSRISIKDWHQDASTSPDSRLLIDLIPKHLIRKNIAQAVVQFRPIFTTRNRDEKFLDIDVTIRLSTLLF